MQRLSEEALDTFMLLQLIIKYITITYGGTMKKLLSSIILSSLILLSACTTQTTESSSVTTTSTSTAASSSESSVESSETASTEAEVGSINIAGLKGPTGIGMAKLLADEDSGYNISILNSPDEVTSGLISSEYDMAAVPANLASVLYNKTEGKIKVLSINTLGVLYIVQKGSTTLEKLSDLKGKTIYASGQGATPEYTLSYLLSEQGVNLGTDVQVEWLSEHTEVISKLSQEEDVLALLPEPFVTVALNSTDGLTVPFDLNQEWTNLGNDSKLITGVLVGRTDFLDSNKALVDEFLTQYKSSIDWVNESPEDAAVIVGQKDIIKEAIAKKAIPACNISYIEGHEMKTALSAYLKILAGFKAEAVGGKLPQDDFYYIK